MKNKKLSLKTLKVSSFVTKQEEVKGGCPVYTDTVAPCTLVFQGCGGGTALYSACGDLQCY